MKFITFEGIEGSGKSTQSKKLNEYFLNKSQETILTREPGGTKTSEQIREILINNVNLDAKTELLLNFASRNEHVEKLIKPSLQNNKIVICDRFFDSTYAYQGSAMGIDFALINKIKELTIGNFAPDITFLIDIDVETSLKRLSNRKDNNRYDAFSVNFHQKVRNGFLKIAKQNSRIKIIDGDKSADEIFSEIINYLNL